jgi:serine/threonine-protein kinase
VVDDPHVIPVHKAGEADGVLFIAMRYMSGAVQAPSAGRLGA